jgi:hypothetical protein
VRLEARTEVDGRSTGLSFEGYAAEGRPVAAYGVMTGAFGAALAATLVALGKSGRFPEQIATRDLVLMGVATHKLSRLLTKDKVTSFLRAPFTEYQEGAGQGEVDEKARGKGIQLAFGELLSCPYCIAQWIAAGFTCGLVASPRTTRLIAGIYVVETISDFLQAAYRAAEQQA